LVKLAAAPRRLPDPANLAAMATTASASLLLALALAALATLAAGDSNGAYDPCSDTRIQRGDGFTFGLAFAGSGAFFSGSTQLSPCDRRLNLNSPSQLAVFRPKVDEISLLTVNTTTGFSPVSDPPPSLHHSLHSLFLLRRVASLHLIGIAGIGWILRCKCLWKCGSRWRSVGLLPLLLWCASIFCSGMCWK
jgi:hypothetical protein